MMTCLNCGKSVFEGALCDKCRGENHQACADQTAQAVAELVKDDDEDT